MPLKPPSAPRFRTKQTSFGTRRHRGTTRTTDPGRYGQHWTATAASFGARHRRLTVALLLCLATGIAVQQLTPVPEQQVSIVVSARDLPVGASVSEADFITAGVPRSASFPGAIQDPARLQGRQLAAPLAKGQIPTETSFLGPGLLTGAPPGSAAVPLRMADPASIRLLSPGQLISVILSATEASESSPRHDVLAGAVPVLWTSAQGDAPGQWPGTSEADGLVVVAADPQQAEKLAGASTHGKLFFMLVHGPQSGPPDTAE
ncbi:RcpC/CpaB family pilus assembly protein [Paenarthrobacter ureafaciens]|uniref:RcpC/CpaB family pilus assembly protein n=1 Tax=Paenarthrobacter ureafaciens TaxID=37931 RepID=UPI001FB1A7BD|nr:RcpC/CpaB family pilus assembly protein [Paenarthrobacter ureafaciens]UOD80156.1 RcpC/CpaB family pilus assembly protein [Paenarthrobacter ureafaciens]WNZ04500.1 RcpC/CpaB family pilus assembly protein [Paenarthrobacter ureafaciens]